jgi:hypothetical protein
MSHYKINKSINQLDIVRDYIVNNHIVLTEAEQWKMNTLVTMSRMVFNYPKIPYHFTNKIIIGTICALLFCTYYFWIPKLALIGVGLCWPLIGIKHDAEKHSALELSYNNKITKFYMHLCSKVENKTKQ